MTLLDALLYVFAAFGFAYVVGHSVISRTAREALWEAGEVAPITRWLVMLVECPACLGFWTGLVAGLVSGWRSRAILLAFFTSGTNLVLATFTGIMPAQSQPKD